MSMPPTDSTTYECGRRGLSSHSDQTPDAEFLKRCRAQTPGLDLDRVMI